MGNCFEKRKSSQLESPSRPKDENYHDLIAELVPELARETEEEEEFPFKCRPKRVLSAKERAEEEELRTMGGNESEKDEELDTNKPLPWFLWWFWTSEWPPSEYDYQPSLQQLKFRKVRIQDWTDEPELDQQSHQKVFEIPLHPGLFQDSEGNFYYLKPTTECESYNVLKEKSVSELLNLYITAMEEGLQKFSQDLAELEIKEKDNPEQTKDSSDASALLRTWWFCSSDWPPENYSYKAQLEWELYRLVNIDNWETEINIDNKGLRKAIEIPLHPGIFQNFFGSQCNYKPDEDEIQSYRVLKTKSFSELLRIYEEAMEKRIVKFKETHSKFLTSDDPVFYKGPGESRDDA